MSSIRFPSCTSPRRELGRQLAPLRRLLGWLGLLVLLLAPDAARADAAASAPPSAESPADERIQRFREHVQAATEHYQSGRYPEAASAFLAAYAIKAHPLLLFNLALVYRKSGQKIDAIRYYERFLAAAPDSPQAAEVQRALRELRDSPPEGASATAAEPQPPGAPADNFLGSEEQRARLFAEHVQRASQHFAAGEYEQAIRSFWAAYALRAQPIILFNVAQAHRRAQQWPQAKALFSRFLREEPGSPVAEEARGLLDEAIDQLRAQRNRQEQEAALRQVQASESLSERLAELREIERQIVATQTALQKRQSRSIVRRPWFWGLLIGGVSLGALGVGLGVWLSRRLPDTELGGQPLTF